MTTGMAFAFLTVAAVGTAAAAVFVLRSVPGAQAQVPASARGAAAQPASSLESPPTLADTDEPSLRSLRSTPEETRPTLVPMRPPARPPIPVGVTAPMGEYDPDQESEDDVPTTLFHSEDSAELEAFIADLDEKRDS